MAQTESFLMSISYDWEIRRLAMSKKLQKAIQSQIDKLQTLLDNVNEVYIIDGQDPNT
jgi:predicted GTPase